MLKFLLGLIIISSLAILIIPKEHVDAVLYFHKEVLFDTPDDGHLKGWNPGEVIGIQTPRSFEIKDNFVQQFKSVVMVNVQDNKPNICGVDFIWTDNKFDVTCLTPPSNQAVLSYIVFDDNSIN